MTKVFCIGFHKTGTTSLGKALELMGYKNCHGAGPLRSKLGETKMMAQLFARDLQAVFDLVDGYDSFNDNPWFMLYRELDEAFPGSKFILMLREEQSWLKSCLRYFGDSTSPFRLWIYGKGSPLGNEQRYLDRYRAHNQAVQAYFADRQGQLLVVDLEDKQLMSKVSAFLGNSLPAYFPHLNRTDIGL